ncbi:phage holin family protein [Pseudoduganella sp. DS3]|uniref:Phage holin family protein n=1 Tax=Pseudoduganella guangdongensis TaxID=2692179 RepID=A0A6N9HGU0_9BURK|nr:phage holin family protein [Pseudoduganella guangdongensis]MYN02045.1 phage holin family protein [Pseudoduganella guangdongensis]
MSAEHQVPPPPGLIASLAGLAKNCLHLLLSRLELAALELTEVRDTLLQLTLVFAVAMLAAWFAIAFGTATLIYLCWEAMGWRILPVLAGVFAVLAVALVLWARSVVRQGKLGLTATMVELKSDRDMLL